jgi:hypothetical protein
MSHPPRPTGEKKCHGIEGRFKMSSNDVFHYCTLRYIHLRAVIVF